MALWHKFNRQKNLRQPCSHICFELPDIIARNAILLYIQRFTQAHTDSGNEAIIVAPRIVAVISNSAIPANVVLPLMFVYFSS